MRYVSYFRVSTQKQGQSGLGLESQQAAVNRFIEAHGGEIIASFTEVETGKRDDRPQIEAALALCRKEGAAILIAKIDRLSRNAGFLLTLKNGSVEIRAADMPHAGTLEFGLRAVIAQHEREMISQRTKDALAAAKARGVKLGNPRPDLAKAHAAWTAQANNNAQMLKPVIAQIRKSGITSYNGIARALNARGVQTPRGGKWYAASVKNVEARQQVDG